MPSLCCVPQCNNRGGHVFPKPTTAEKVKLREAWVSAIKRVSDKHGRKWIPKDYMVVCQAHFKTTDYLQGTETLHGKCYVYVDHYS